MLLYWSYCNIQALSKPCCAPETQCYTSITSQQNSDNFKNPIFNIFEQYSRENNIFGLNYLGNFFNSSF